MITVIMAGGLIKEDDPLFDLIPIGKVKNKAYLDIGGKPMVQWVLDALAPNPKVDQIVINGLPEDDTLTCTKPIHFRPDLGSMLENTRGAIMTVEELDSYQTYTLLVSCDIPSIQTEMVDWLLEEFEKNPVDMLYQVVTEEVMEARFPNSNRSFTALKGGRYCGGDINILANHVVTGKDTFWNRLRDAGKNSLKQASIIGFPLLFIVLFRLRNLEGVAQYVSKRLELEIRAVISPFAEVAMDVDKPHQYHLLEKDLTGKG